MLIIVHMGMKKGPFLPSSVVNRTMCQSLDISNLLKRLFIYNLFCALTTLSSIFEKYHASLFQIIFIYFSSYTKLLPSLLCIVNVHSSFSEHLLCKEGRSFLIFIKSFPCASNWISFLLSTIISSLSILYISFVALVDM